MLWSWEQTGGSLYLVHSEVIISEVTVDFAGSFPSGDKIYNGGNWRI